MDGNAGITKIRDMLLEASTSSFCTDRVTYEYLYEAVKEFCKRTGAFTSTQTITTVANQSAYSVNPDYLRLYFLNESNKLIIKYTQASGAITWISWRDYDRLIQNQQTTAVAIPYSFTITDDSDTPALDTGTATATGTLSYGESTLTDSTATFLTTAYAGDTVHNITDGSTGYITSVTSNTAVQTALFGGTNNYWASTNTYAMSPQPRKQLILDPPPSTSGDTITLNYVCSLPPVYSLYRSYRIDSDFTSAITAFAAFNLKYRDRQPDFGNAFWKIWDTGVRQATDQYNRGFSKQSFHVNMIKRSYRDRSYR